MAKVVNGVHPDRLSVKGMTVKAVAEEWFSQQPEQALSTTKHQSGYVRLIKECFNKTLVSEQKEKQVYDFISSIFEKTPITAKYTLCVLKRGLNYAKIVYKLQIPDLSEMQNLFKAPPVKHTGHLLPREILMTTSYRSFLH